MLAIYALLVLLSCRVAQTVALKYPDPEESLPISYSGFFNNMWYLYSLYGQCTYQDIVSCLKQKLATTINRLVKNKVRVPLLDGVHFVKSAERDSEIKNTREDNLQRALEASDLSLASLLTNGIYDFLKTHVLEVSCQDLFFLRFSHLHNAPPR